MDHALRPDCRRFVCDRCGKAVYVCSWCDRGHRYCSQACREAARRRSLRAAGRRYQQSRRGRRNHARRQAAYRRRQRARAQKVTHHGCRAVRAPATVSTCPRSPPLRFVLQSQRPDSGRIATPYRLCGLCGAACEPFVRDDFLRRRRF